MMNNKVNTLTTFFATAYAAPNKHNQSKADLAKLLPDLDLYAMSDLMRITDTLHAKNNCKDDPKWVQNWKYQERPYPPANKAVETSFDPNTGEIMLAEPYRGIAAYIHSEAYDYVMQNA